MESFFIISTEKVMSVQQDSLPIFHMDKKIVIVVTEKKSTISDRIYLFPVCETAAHL